MLKLFGFVSSFQGADEDSLSIILTVEIPGIIID